MQVVENLGFETGRETVQELGQVALDIGLLVHLRDVGYYFRLEFAWQTDYTHLRLDSIKSLLQP